MTSNTVRHSELFYDQVTSDQSQDTLVGGESTKGKQSSVNTRDLTSDSTTTGTKGSGSVGASESVQTSESIRNSESVQDSESNRAANSLVTSAKASSARANVAFTLSFSIPLTGIMPTNGNPNASC